MDARGPAHHWLELAQHRAQYTPDSSANPAAVEQRYARLFHTQAAQIGYAPLMNCSNAVAHGIVLARVANGDWTHWDLPREASVKSFVLEQHYYEVASIRFHVVRVEGRIQFQPVAEGWPCSDPSLFPAILQNDLVEATIMDRQPDGSWAWCGRWCHDVGAVQSSGTDAASFWATEVVSMDRTSLQSHVADRPGPSPERFNNQCVAPVRKL